MADNEETLRLVFGDDWYARVRAMNTENRAYVLGHARAAAAEMSEHLGKRVELDERPLLVDDDGMYSRPVSKDEMRSVVKHMQSEEGRKSKLDLP